MAPEILMTAQLDEVNIQDALTFLGVGSRFDLTLTGTLQKRVSLKFERKPLRWILAELERQSGLSLGASGAGSENLGECKSL